MFARKDRTAHPSAAQQLADADLAGGRIVRLPCPPGCATIVGNMPEPPGSLLEAVRRPRRHYQYMITSGSTRLLVRESLGYAAAMSDGCVALATALTASRQLPPGVQPTQTRREVTT